MMISEIAVTEGGQDADSEMLSGVRRSDQQSQVYAVWCPEGVYYQQHIQSTGIRHPKKSLQMIYHFK